MTDEESHVIKFFVVVIKVTETLGSLVLLPVVMSVITKVN